MKTKLILTLASMLLFVTGLKAATKPYAVFCGDNSLHFLTASTPPTGSHNSLTINEVYEVNLTQAGTSPEWSKYSSTTTTVIFEESFKNVTPNSCKSWFADFKNLTQIENLDYLNTSKVTYLSNMFDGCKSLTSLDLSNFNTSNVVFMISMFRGCSGLTSLDLSSFDTSKVTSMNLMFSSCTNLTELDLSTFDTSKVTDMGSMFSGCKSLTSLDLSSFNTSNVVNMRYMFYNCSSLTTLNLSSFDTSNVWNMDFMFKDCSGLERIYVSNKFTTTAVTESYDMFTGCTKFENYNSGNVDAEYANYETGYFTYFNPGAVFDSGSKTLTFKNGSPTEEDFYTLNQGSDTPGWSSISAQIEKVVFDEFFKEVKPTSCYQWFFNFSGLTEIVNLDYLNTSNVTKMTCMFQNCSSLNSLDLSTFDTSNVTDMGYMFQNCGGLTSLNLSNFDTSNVTSMTNMFSYCGNLTTLNLNNFDFSRLSSYDYMFFACTNLRLVDLSEAVACNAIVNIIPENALVYAPADTEVSGGRENVVVGETCANFVINSGTTENNQILLNIPKEFTANRVLINRTFEQGKPYSLYVPFAISGTDFGTFYTYTGYTETTVQFDPVTGTTEANKPYMLLPNESSADGIVIEGSVTVKPTPENVEADPDGYVGVYEKKTFTEAEVSTGSYYGWVGEEFRRAGNGASVDACRAYFKLPSSAATNAPARLAAKFGDDDLSGISDINSDDTTKDSPCYNLNGQRVNSNTRGIVIKDGKKVLNPSL